MNRKLISAVLAGTMVFQVAAPVWAAGGAQMEKAVKEQGLSREAGEQAKLNLQVLGVSGENTGAGEVRQNAFDGNLKTKWCHANTTEGWIVFKTDSPVMIDRLRIVHAGGSENYNDSWSGYNTEDFSLQILKDPSSVPDESGYGDDNLWTDLDERIRNNNDDVSNIKVENRNKYQYYRLRIYKGQHMGGFDAIRIYEIELYESTLQNPTEVKFTNLSNDDFRVTNLRSIRYVEQNSTYTLPEAVLVPDYRKITGWILNDKTYKPGEQIVITEDCELRPAGFADNTVTYWDPISHTEKTTKGKIVDATMEDLGEEGKTSWYVINSSIKESLEFHGNVNLILAEGADYRPYWMSGSNITLWAGNANPDKWGSITLKDKLGVGENLTVNGGNLNINMTHNSESLPAITCYKGSVILNGGNIHIENEQSYGKGMEAENILLKGGNLTMHFSETERICGIYGNITLDGNAFVNIPNTTHPYPEMPEKTKTLKSGIFFENKVGNVYGSPVIDRKIVIPLDHTLTVKEGETLTVKEALFKNEGTVINEGTIKSTGQIPVTLKTVNGTFEDGSTEKTLKLDQVAKKKTYHGEALLFEIARPSELPVMIPDNGYKNSGSWDQNPLEAELKADGNVFTYTFQKKSSGHRPVPKPPVDVTDITVTTPDQEIQTGIKPAEEVILKKAEDVLQKDSAKVTGNQAGITLETTKGQKPVTNFEQPITVTIPVSPSDQALIKNPSNLTLALIRQDESGKVSVEYLGGSLDSKTGLFTAKVDEAGIYVLVEKDNLTKLLLTVGSTETLKGDEIVRIDSAPVIENSRTMVPLRYIGEALGAEISWNGKNRSVKVEKDGITLNMQIGKEIPGYGQPPILKNNRTLVPIRYISEALGANVIYDPACKEIIIVK